ncbi:MAG: hypothetical protein Q7T89_19130, partial [Anaerolineales bacterium]|nr:hypothetical protein [Anaerolineales bacterium]
MATKSENQVKAEATEVQPIIPIVDKFWIVGLMFYLVALGVISVWALIAFFPCEIAPEAAATCSKVVGFMFWNFTVSSEVRMILLVLIAGALGSL